MKWIKKSLLAMGVISLLGISSLVGFTQTNWTKFPDNPVMTPGAPGSFNAGGYAFITVLKNNDTLNMWYTASDQVHQKIGLAQSVNGYEFSFCDSVPFFEGSGMPATFDSQGVFNPQILKAGDTTWYMWYGGLDNTNFNSEIGLAVSNDGLQWERYSGQPVLGSGWGSDFDALLLYPGTVLYDEGVYKMWYTGMNYTYMYKIGYATSPDGIVWTKYEDNPILTFGSANPEVEKTEEGYRMWYNESVGGVMYISYALSEDGINWQCSDAPVLCPGNYGSFDDEGVTAPSVLHDDATGLYRLWYTAWSNSNNTYSVGYATDSTLVSTSSPEWDESSALNIYPNPLTSQSVIAYSIPESSPVSLSLYNSSGTKLLQLDGGTKSKGTYRITLVREQLPAGIYVCRLITNGRSSACRLVVSN